MIFIQKVAFRLSNMLAEDEEFRRTEGRNVKGDFAGKLCEMVIVCCIAYGLCLSFLA